MSVVRAGAMSNGIAQVVALTGLNVVMIDMTDVALKKWEHCIRVPSARGTRQAESTHA
ncbi:3-hydroxyacyl-CoA dehydrogenase NAD-binding domain-containing protein [Paraburkholderia sp. SIMBA_049]